MRSRKSSRTPDRLGSIIRTSGQIGMEEATRRARSAVRRFRWAIRPIYALLPRNQVEHIATCILLEVGGVRLLVTAAHVVDQHTKDSSLLIGGRDRIVNLEAQFQKTKAPGDERDADHFDFAFAPLTEEMVATLGAVAYIPESAVSLGRRADGRYFYHCVGFPNSKNKDIFPGSHLAKTRLWPYTSYGKLSHEITDSWYNPEAHLFIDFNPKHSRDAGTGQIVNTIKPKGVSGGPVFFVSAFSDPEELRPGRQANTPLEGIMIERNTRNGAVVAVKINVVLAAARKVGVLPS